MHPCLHIYLSIYLSFFLKFYNEANDRQDKLKSVTQRTDPVPPPQMRQSTEKPGLRLHVLAQKKRQKLNMSL